MSIFSRLKLTETAERKKKKDCLQGWETGDITNVSKMIDRDSRAATRSQTHLHTSINYLTLKYEEQITKICVMVIFLQSLLSSAAVLTAYLICDSLENYNSKEIQCWKVSFTDQIFKQLTSILVIFKSYLKRSPRIHFK